MSLSVRLASYPMGFGMAGAGLLTAFLITGMIPGILPVPPMLGWAGVVLLAMVGIGGTVLFTLAMIRNGSQPLLAVVMALFAAGFSCVGVFAPVWFGMTYYAPTLVR